MTAIPFMIAFLAGSAFSSWLNGGGTSAPQQGGFTWIDWMFAIAISMIGGPTLAIVMVRLIYWHQRRSDAAREASATRLMDEALRDFSLSRRIEPAPADHSATIVVISTSGEWTSGMPEMVYLAAVGNGEAPAPFVRKGTE